MRRIRMMVMMMMMVVIMVIVVLMTLAMIMLMTKVVMVTYDSIVAKPKESARAPFEAASASGARSKVSWY